MEAAPRRTETTEKEGETAVGGKICRLSWYERSSSLAGFVSRPRPKADSSTLPTLSLSDDLIRVDGWMDWVPGYVHNISLSMTLSVSETCASLSAAAANPFVSC